MNQPPEEKAERYIPAGGQTVVYEAPPQPAYTLNRLEFLTLCEGEETRSAERWRDVCIAIGFTALAAFLAMVAELGFKEMSNFYLIVCFFLAVTSAACLVLGAYFFWRVSKTQDKSSYGHVREKISNFFERV